MDTSGTPQKKTKFKKNACDLGEDQKSNFCSSSLSNTCEGGRPSIHSIHSITASNALACLKYIDLYSTCAGRTTYAHF